MWARCCEVLLGAWLCASPWILGLEPRRSTMWWVTILGGAAVVVCAVLSVWPTQRKAHLVSLAIASGLVATGWGWRSPGDAASENLVLTGLVLAMLTIVPNAASRPPPGW